MDVTSAVGLVAILGIWGTSLFAERKGGRSSVYTVRMARWMLFISVGAVVTILCYFSRQQFLAWHGSEYSRYLLPPYQPMSYFLAYIGRHFWAPHIISFVVAVVAYAALCGANRLRGGMLFEREEIIFIAAAIFLSGHPGYVAYIILVGAAYAVISLARLAIFRRDERVSFYRLWLPCAAIIMIARFYLVRYGWYTDLLI